jgi:hypothetical protein
LESKCVSIWRKSNLLLFIIYGLKILDRFAN